MDYGHEDQKLQVRKLYNDILMPINGYISTSSFEKQLVSPFERQLSVRLPGDHSEITA